MVMMVLMTVSGLLPALPVVRDAETDVAELAIEPMSRGDAVRNRHEDLNGHRQHEKQSCQPPPGHKETHQSFENATRRVAI